MKNIAIISLIILNSVFIYLLYSSDSKVDKIFSEKEAEPFRDLNGNGEYNIGEPFEDLNANKRWDDAVRKYIEKTVDMERLFINGKLSQETIYFEDGQINGIRKYNNGIKHGDWIIYYESNSDSLQPKIKTELEYVDGGLIEEVEYFTTGMRKKLSSNPNSDSIIDIINYFSSGQKHSEGQMILTKSGMDAWYGDWIWYNEEDGSVKNEQSFDKDF